jgi:dihydroorotase
MLHGEVPSNNDLDICVMNAEERFLPELVKLHEKFPNLRIVLEHVTTAAAVECVKSLGDTVAATITAHHLDLTIDEWAGKNHNFCKPVAKYPHDRAALRQVVIDGHPRFFMGSDSAPHPRSKKEGACGCAGVFTSPLLIPYLADCFERLGCIDRLRGFTSTFGCRFHRLIQGRESITLVKIDNMVPYMYGDTVPYRAGEVLSWKLGIC